MITIIVIILIIVALPVLYLVGVYRGIEMGKTHSIDYKERWQQAVRTLESVMSDDPDAKEKLAALTRQPGDNLRAALTRTQSPASINRAADQAYLLRLTGTGRWELEGARLDAGLDPIDPLTYLNEYWYIRMVKRRYEEGYEEEG